MISRFENWCEIMNNTFILVSGYFMLMFTEWIWDLELRYELGEIFVYMLVKVIVVNLFLIVKDMCNGVKKMIMRR